jgi:hypothetical protein
VENALRSCPDVTDAAVLPTPDGTGLTAWLVTAPGYDAPALRKQLAQTLPAPAVPGTLRTVPELPRTAHGKIDFDALHALTADCDTPADTPVPPPADGSDLRSLVRAAWCAVLERSSVANDVNFFDAGGHSLLVPLLQMEIEDRAHTRLAVVDLFTATTVDAQAALIAASCYPAADTAENPAADPAADPRRSRLAAGRARRSDGSGAGS